MFRKLEENPWVMYADASLRKHGDRAAVVVTSIERLIVSAYLRTTNPAIAEEAAVALALVQPSVDTVVTDLNTTYRSFCRGGNLIRGTSHSIQVQATRKSRRAPVGPGSFAGFRRRLATAEIRRMTESYRRLPLTVAHATVAAVAVPIPKAIVSKFLEPRRGGTGTVAQARSPSLGGRRNDRDLHEERRRLTLDASTDPRRVTNNSDVNRKQIFVGHTCVSRRSPRR
ncbi:hypothetical protein HPB51_008867 [Rhipicephalus microplus]|uniref:Tick transposon n=1 Tax=Rhipicephalus microplus TaxID=6941 RepID=A0A9J6ES17_RHIMP|nr:hypothetical protein HPB51_008867 [Rhipicephalus microplus]